MTMARQIVLAARPKGKPLLTDFRLEGSSGSDAEFRADSAGGALSFARPLCARTYG